MEYLKHSLFYCTDKLGDGALYLLDEAKFWGEVVIEFMEWDKSGSDEMVDEYRKELRSQIKD